jgi:cell division protein FtsB
MKAAREKGLVEVYEKISQKKREKKQEEDRLAKELKEIKLQRQYLNANRAMVEEKAWKELEAGAEREIRNA